MVAVVAPAAVVVEDARTRMKLPCNSSVNPRACGFVRSMILWSSRAPQSSTARRLTRFATRPGRVQLGFGIPGPRLQMQSLLSAGRWPPANVPRTRAATVATGPSPETANTSRLVVRGHVTAGSTLRSQALLVDDLVPPSATQYVILTRAIGPSTHR